MTGLKPYTLPLSQGWNMISLPGVPARPDLASIFSRASGVGPVLAYRDNDWETAIQQEDGRWRGRLTAVEVGYGYWVHAREQVVLATSLLPLSPSAPLGNLVSLVPGWNLIGIVDTELRPFGESASTRTLDRYLEGIPWRVAYRYDTNRALWSKCTPGDGSLISNGYAYWLWVGASETRIPKEPPLLGKDASIFGSGFPPFN